MNYSANDLKAIAKYLEIKFHPQLGTDKLLILIEKECAEREKTIDEVMAEAAIVSEQDLVEQLKNFSMEDAIKNKQAINARTAVRDANRLIRVVVTSNVPAESRLFGKIFGVGNAKVGLIQRMIPFGVTWHVPKMLVNSIINKKVQIFRRKKESDRPISVIIPAYNVRFLDPITSKEFDDIRKRQLADPVEEISM